MSSLTYTYTPSSALPLGAATPVDHWIDFQGVATDLAGNVGYTDSSSSVNAGVLEKYGAHHIKIDQKLPSISAAYTGWWWDTSIDSKNKVVTLKGKGRHDPCVVPRAVPIVESMAANVIVDLYLQSKS